MQIHLIIIIICVLRQKISTSLLTKIFVYYSSLFTIDTI